MITLVSLSAVAIGTVLLSIANSIASKTMSGAGALLMAAGLMGATYGFIDGSRATISNPPDVPYLQGSSH